MTGLNRSLPQNEKVQCLCCLTTKEPIIKENKVICASCDSVIQTYLQIRPVPKWEDSQEIDH